MRQENNNWFARHRTAVFGIAVAVLILNVVLLLVVPSQTPIQLDQRVIEYAVDDESFAQEHTLRLDGTLTSAAFSSSTFTGTLSISGVPGLEQPVSVYLIREDARWQWASDIPSGLHRIDAGKTFDELVITLCPAEGFDAETAHFFAPAAAHRRAALVQLSSYFG